MWYSDLAFYSYVATAATGFWGFGLFFWWLGKNNLHASLMFIYVMLLLLGAGVRGLSDAHARYLHLTDPEAFYCYSRTIWWSLRSLFPLAIKLLIVVHMTYRAFSGRSGVNGFIGGIREGLRSRIRGE